MIINRTKADEAWSLLVSHARVADEVWDQQPITLDGMTEDTLNRAYRTAARYTHPDTGGTLEQFAAVDRAKHILIRWLAQRPTAAVDAVIGGLCAHCEGAGNVRVQRGFRSMRVSCPKCHGTGDSHYTPDKTGD